MPITFGVSERERWRTCRSDAFFHPRQRYSRFCERYREWRGKLDVAMRQVHRAGEKAFVDYAGPMFQVVDRKTGEVRDAMVLVGVLGASNHTFVDVTRSRSLPDWTNVARPDVRVPWRRSELVIPDNEKAAVHRASRYEPELNRTYRELAAHLRHHGARRPPRPAPRTREDRARAAPLPAPKGPGPAPPRRDRRRHQLQGAARSRPLPGPAPRLRPVDPGRPDRADQRGHGIGQVLHRVRARPLGLPRRHLDALLPRLAPPRRTRPRTGRRVVSQGRPAARTDLAPRPRRPGARLALGTGTPRPLEVLDDRYARRGTILAWPARSPSSTGTRSSATPPSATPSSTDWSTTLTASTSGVPR